MLWKILKDIFSQKGVLPLLILGIIVQVLFIALPYFGRYFVNFIEAGNLGQDFWNLIGLSSIVLLVFLLFSIFQDYYFTGIRAKYEVSKLKKYHKQFLELDYDVRVNEGTGKTITKITRGVGAQVQLFRVFVDFAAVFITRIVLIGGIFLSIYPPIILILLIAALSLGVLNVVLSKKIKEQTDREQKLMEDVGRQTSKIIMESTLIKTMNREEEEISNLELLTNTVPKIRQKIFLLNGVFYNVLDFIVRAIEIGCYAVLGIMVVQNAMTLGDLTMTIAYIGWLWWPIAMLVNNIVEVRNQISKVEALENLVNTPSKIIDGKKKFVLSKGDIFINDIDFSYDGKKKIFNDFTLDIPGGKTLALVGNSGSGKSTLIKLILRDYNVNNGSIEIDGQNINDLKISTLYDNIGYLSQEPAVFDGTIRENLQYATKKRLSKNDILEALKKVDLYDLVCSSEEKLDTEIGERGLKLSGGEKQRLAIARVFLRNPKILILDEPTSSLDSISENKITQILNNIMKGRTVIVIAHRLQTVMEADKIVVLKDGNIIETGTHNQLIKQKGMYSKLVDLQKGVIKK